MAILNSEEEDLNQTQGMNQTNPNAPQPNQPQVSGSSSAPTSGATPSATSQQAANPKASSGSFTNIRQYINANQGNKLGSSVNKQVSNTATGAQKAIGQGTSAFGQKVEQGTLANRENAVSDISNIVQAARGVTAQPQTAPDPATTAPTTPAATTPAQAPAQAPSYLEGLDTNRFSDVINAKYSGPESLRQAGLYDPISGKVQTAQTQINQSQTASGREDLLKDIFSKNKQYTQGQNKLDSLLLNTSKNDVQSLLDQKAKAGDLGQQLQTTQNTSQNLAQNRAKEVAGIQGQAREAFGTGQAAERDATDERLSKVVENWEQLPEYYREIIRKSPEANQSALDAKLAEFSSANRNVSSAEVAAANKAMLNAKKYQNTVTNSGGYGTHSASYTNQVKNKAKAAAEAAASNYNNLLSQQKSYNTGVSGIRDNTNLNALNLSPEEAAVLGISSGEGLYNLGENAIVSGVADKNKLISRDEQARQFALSQLAGLDTSKALDTNVKYSDLGAAGTQTALDALDTKGTRAALNEAEKNFREQAQSQTITGTGSKKNKTSGKRYYANESANLGNVLSNAGYNFDNPLSTQVGNTDILKNIAGSVNYDQDPNTIYDTTGVSGITDIVTGQGGTGIAEQLGNVYGAGSGINILTNAAGLGNLGSALGGLAGGFTGGLFGGGSSSGESKSDAAKIARADLEKKLQAAVKSSGFQNRSQIGNTDQSDARALALRDLLAKMDKTNV